MKSLCICSLLIPVATAPLQATLCSLYLRKGHPHTAYPHIRGYVYSYGLDFVGDEARPHRLKIFAGLGIDHVGPAHDTGAPEWVEVITRFQDITRVSFERGDPLGKSRSVKGKQMTVELLDADEKPTSGKPVYFHVTDFNGTQYRLHAQSTKTHLTGFPIFTITPEGEKHLFSDSGFEILMDENGQVRQFRNVDKIQLISYPDERTRLNDLYLTNQLLPEKQNGLYVLKPGSKPERQYRLVNPESDEFKLMKQEIIENGEIVETTVWTRGNNPFVYKFQTRIAGQDLPTRDDNYFKDENGETILHRKYYRDEGKYQLDRKSKNIKGMGWQVTYKKELKDGVETLEGYSYIEEWEGGKTVKRQTLHKGSDGNWFRKAYDADGRLTLHCTPVVEEIPAGEGIGDQDVLALLDGFAEPASAKKKLRYLPESPPEDLSSAPTAGNLVRYAYTSHFQGDEVSLDDERPRTVSTWKKGQFISHEWFGYGFREDGVRYENYERSNRVEGQRGADDNIRRNREFHPKTNPVAPGRLKSILHEDGQLEVFYYDKGTFQREQQFFQADENGPDLRIVSTRGELKDNNWTFGTRSRTRIENKAGTLLLEYRQILDESGAWKNLEEDTPSE